MSESKQSDLHKLCWNLYIWGPFPTYSDPSCPWDPGVQGTTVYDPEDSDKCYAYAYYDATNGTRLNEPVLINQQTSIRINIITANDNVYASSFACTVEDLSIIQEPSQHASSKLAYFAIVDATTLEYGNQIPVARLMPREEVNFNVTFPKHKETVITCGPDQITCGKITIFVVFGDENVIIPCDPEYDHDEDPPVADLD